MKNREGAFAPPAVGGSSLLVIFAVLCLTVFALLGLATVQADVRLADASVKAVEDYYAADCAAEEILAGLRQGRLPEEGGVAVTGGPAAGSYDALYTYAVPISDTQQLEVEVAMLNGGFEVVRWQAVPVGDWVFSEDLDLWDGLPF